MHSYKYLMAFAAPVLLSQAAAHEHPTATLTDPAITTNPGFQACATVHSLGAACDHATPGFHTLTEASVMASCLCYPGGGSWKPAEFDSVWDKCIGYASTADPVQYSAFSMLGGTSAPCAKVGDVRATATAGVSTGSGASAPTSTSSTGTTSTPTASPSPRPNAAGRMTVGGVVSNFEIQWPKTSANVTQGIASAVSLLCFGTAWLL